MRVPYRRRPSDKHAKCIRSEYLVGSVAIAVAGLIGTLPQPVLAQAAVSDQAAGSSSKGVLQEVVVTAQRRHENLQAVPITVNAVSAEQLQSSGVINYEQLPALVPGLAFGITQDAFQPRLRGVGTAFFGPGIENPVALYVDDVYYSSQLMAPTDLTDVAQISVLKGPQGTLFGRNTTGGVIQMTTMGPESQFGGFFRTDLDNYLTTHNTVYVTGPLGNTLESSLAVKYATQGHGWGRNLVDGADIDKLDTDFSVRNKWLWTPASGTSIRLNLDYTHRTDSMGPNYCVRSPPGVSGIFPGCGSTIFPSNPYDVTNVLTDKNRLKQGGASIDIRQDVGFGSVRSITAYRHYDFENFTDSAGSSEFESTVYQHPTGYQLSQELQLLSKEGGPVKWLAGIFYFYGADNLPQDLYYYDYYSLAYFGFDGASASSVVDDNFKVHLTTQSIAGFFQTTIRLGQLDNLTLGLRDTSERRTINGPTTAYIDGVLDPDPFVTYLYDEQYKNSKWTWRAAWDHTFTKDVMGYASYNRGFKSGGFNAFFLAPPYAPEVVDAYELGLKSELADHRLRLNVAGFYNKYTNMQQLVVSGLFLEVKNAASAGIYGLDFDGQWRATERLTFSGGFEWLHARYKSFADLPYSVAVPGGGIASYPNGPNGELLPARDGTGNALPYAPNFTGNVAIDYTVPLNVDTLDFNVTDSYNSGFFFEPDNFAHQGSFDLVNASATWSNDQLSIGLFGKNLGNRVVPTFVAATPPVGFLADYGNAPRTYGIYAQYRFVP